MIDVIPPTSEYRNIAAITVEIAVPNTARLAANVKNLRLLATRSGSAAFMPQPHSRVADSPVRESYRWLQEHQHGDDDEMVLCE